LLYLAVARPGDYKDALECVYKRALHDRVVFNGESHSGFIYFGLQEQEMLRRIRALRAELKTTTTDQIVVLTFDLDLSKEESTDEKATKGQ
jgi:hypothetical protein